MDDAAAREMYQEHILDHYQHPHNFGSLEGATHTCNDNNPLCGDDLTMQLIVDGDDRVTDVKFSGRGCAISMASASLLTDKIKGMTLDEVRTLVGKDVLDMLLIPIGPVRMKCALLSLRTLQKAVGLENSSSGTIDSKNGKVE